jgi:hypothetical protein
MANFTEKDIEFLSNQELIVLLRSLLEEIDLVASAGAHRSTTYLAVSAIEGLFGELLTLLRIPHRADLTLEQREQLLHDAGALPKDFEDLYKPVRRFRNYMHPDRELKNKTPIDQSTGQLALACLNALIEKYARKRFAGGQVWEQRYGLAKVPEDKVIHMPQIIGDDTSLLISELAADKFREMTFQVVIPPAAIFNFVYNYFSLDKWSAARIEGREGQGGKGYDNGKILCHKWRAWAIDGRYTTEPNPTTRQHTVRVLLDPPEQFALTVDGVALVLQAGTDWAFDSKGKVGFMTQLGAVSVTDLEVRAK